MYSLYHIHKKEERGIYSTGYIGITDNADRRRAEHFRKLSTGTHPNPKLQSAFNQYELEFSIITEAVEREIVATLEESFRPYPDMAWNLKKGGEGVSIEDLLEIDTPTGDTLGVSLQEARKLKAEERIWKEEKLKSQQELAQQRLVAADRKLIRAEEKHKLDVELKKLQIQQKSRQVAGGYRKAESSFFLYLVDRFLSVNVVFVLLMLIVALLLYYFA